MVYIEKNSVRITGYDNILSFDDAQIKIGYQNSTITITGVNLKFIMMSKEEISISGNINGVNLDE